MAQTMSTDKIARILFILASDGYLDDGAVEEITERFKADIHGPDARRSFTRIMDGEG